MHKTLLIAGSFLLSAQVIMAQPLVSAQETPGALSQSVENEVQAAINRGLAWLAHHQKEDGSWSNSDFPALTGLPLQAFAMAGNERYSENRNRAARFVLASIQPDGGIYRPVSGRRGGGLSTYNTAVCMTALHFLGDPGVARIVQNARSFIAGTQHFGGDVYAGGFGYDADTDRAYADLLNTVYAVEAMRVTQSVEDSRPRGEQRVDIDWSQAVRFIEQMQNVPGEVPEKDEGGFFYRPGESKAGTGEGEDGEIIFRSYGSMTYAGMLALIYAEVDRDDVRVRSAMDWASRHWTLAENPGMGNEGLFYFYNVLTKCLSAYGADMLPVQKSEDQTQLLNWRREVAEKLVSLQKIDPQTGTGYWENDSGRFWESDPVLVTAYTLIALLML